MSVGGLVLAAGEGSRFGGTKQLAEVRGRPLLEHALAAVSQLPARVVVLGHAADEIRAAVDLQGARAVLCEDWREGQAASLRCGIEALDDAALIIALRSQAGYVGAMGSRRAQESRRERLLAKGVTDEELARISAPIGLDLGALTAEETALSIMAEIVAMRYGREGGRLSHAKGRIHEVGV